MEEINHVETIKTGADKFRRQHKCKQNLFVPKKSVPVITYIA